MKPSEAEEFSLIDELDKLEAKIERELYKGNRMTHIDDDGRECSKCGKYKPWNEYHINNSKKHGHQSRCKECHNKYTRDGANMRCKTCGAPLDKPTAKYCGQCRTKRQRLAVGNWYLVLRDPSECHPFLGRQIDALSLEYGLKDGHLPSGMLLQHIAWGRPQGLHVVRGKALRVQWLEELSNETE